MQKPSLKSIVTTLLVLALALVAGPGMATAADASSCVGGSYRGADFAAGVSSTKGVKGVIQVPRQGEIFGLNYGPSAGDVYLARGSDFVQVGWLLGTASQLPYSNSPRMFIGEYYPGQTNNEYLRSGPALA